MIVEQLTIRDLFNLWITSPTMPVALPQRFWRSRFKPGMDRGYIIEAWPLRHVPDVDWYTLFWESKELLSSGVRFHINNRRRILPAIDRIAELAFLYQDALPMGDDSNLVDPILLESDGLILHRKSLTLPPPDKLKSVHISTIYLGSIQYLCGLRVNDDADGLGYCHFGTSHTCRSALPTDRSVRSGSTWIGTVFVQYHW